MANDLVVYFSNLKSCYQSNIQDNTIFDFDAILFENEIFKNYLKSLAAAGSEMFSFVCKIIKGDKLVFGILCLTLNSPLYILLYL